MLPSAWYNEIVNSDTGRQPSEAALPCEGELSRLRNGGTPASLLSSRRLMHSIRCVIAELHDILYCHKITQGLYHSTRSHAPPQLGDICQSCNGLILIREHRH